MSNILSFHCLHFNDLSLDQLYDLMKLRQEVFIVEQNCPYLDNDGKDQESHHVLGLDSKGQIHACTRLVPPDISYPNYSSIGRVATSAAMRGKRQGSPLMQYSIDRCLEIWPSHPIKISAQTYIVKFYNNLGFVVTGNEYLEDDIPHIAMIRAKD